MSKKSGDKTPSKLFFIWILLFIVLLIKSFALLASMYNIDIKVLLFSVYAITPLFFLISFSFIFSLRGHLFYLFVLDLFISILFMVDLVYSRAFGQLISVHMMFAKGVMGDLDASIISLLNWSDFLMLADLPFFLFIAIKNNITEKIIKKKLLVYLSIIISAAGIYNQFEQLENRMTLGNFKLYPVLMSPIGNHFYDFYRFVYEKADKLDNQDIASIDVWLRDNIKYQEADMKYKYLEGIFKGKNIITIQVESLENILIGKKYFGQEITPNINKILSSSIYFDNFHEQVKEGNSSDAELLALTSMYPISNGSAFLRFGQNNYVTLPKLLKENGYTSVAIHGDDKQFWNRDIVFPALGFDRYVSEENFTDKKSCGLGILDQSLFSQSILEINKLNKPYNLFIITITSHIPYKLDKEYQSLDLPEEDDTSNYLQSIHYTDKVFGDFYNSLEAAGVMDDTVLVIYGDHEGIHKYYDTALPDNNYEVPLIIHAPGMKGYEVSKTGGQVDIMPTMAYLFGIDKSKYASGVMGRNLFGSDSGTVLLSTGEILGESNDREHLDEAHSLADLIIRGNYFEIKEKSKNPL